MVNKEFDPKTEFKDAMDAQVYRDSYRPLEGIYTALENADKFMQKHGVARHLGVDKSPNDIKMLLLYIAQRNLRTTVYDISFFQRFNLFGQEAKRDAADRAMPILENYMQKVVAENYSSEQDRHYVRTLELAVNDLYARASTSGFSEATTRLRIKGKMVKQWGEVWKQRIQQSTAS